MDGVTGTGGPTTRKRQAMVVRAFLAQNVAVGCAFGGFGVSVLPLQQLYGASRGATTLALALAVLVLGLVSPAVGSLIGRIGLRWTMTIGTLISGIGYALLAIAPSMPVVLLLYALPIGVGLAMFGPFPASVLASRSYPHNPGPALGFANTPLLVAVLPIVGSAVVRAHGLPVLFLLCAALHLAVLPFMLTVSDGPVGRVSAGHGAGGGQGGMLSAGSVLRSPAFWVMSLGAGYLNAAGITGVSHLVPFVAERGVPAAQGAVLLSITGGAAVLGSLLVGFLCGKFGASRTLALIAACLTFAWIVLLSTTQISAMAAATLLTGAGGAGVFPAVNLLSGRLFGIASLPRVIGLFGLVTLPLTFCIPPLTGVLRDLVGSYGPVIAAMLGGCALVALVFLMMGRRIRQADIGATA